MSKQKINATHYEDIPVYGNGAKRAEHRVNAIIETPKNSRHKYALKAEYGIIAFHDVLPNSLKWPFDYGFIPQTLADDGDPLDILVINKAGLFSGCLIEVRVLGAIRETKDGVENDRLIAVPLTSPGAPQKSDDYREIEDLPQETFEEIKAFLKDYSSRQGHAIDVKPAVNASDAMRLVKQAMKVFRRNGS